MTTSRLVIVLSGIVLFMFIFTPIASAAPDPTDGMWWQGKLTFKGYRYTTDGGNALGDQATGSAKVWIYTRYLTDSAEYEAFTCGITSPYDPDNYGWETTTINLADRYLGNQISNEFTQMWNWDKTTGLLFTAVPYNIATYPVILVKLKPPVRASLSTVSCSAYVYDAALDTYVLGQCTLKAKSIDPGKVSSTVPQPCLDELLP